MLIINQSMNQSIKQSIYLKCITNIAFYNFECFRHQKMDKDYQHNLEIKQNVLYLVLFWSLVKLINISEITTLIKNSSKCSPLIRNENPCQLSLKRRAEATECLLKGLQRLFCPNVHTSSTRIIAMILTRW